MKTILFLFFATVCVAGPVRVATFRADVTPPVGAPLCGGLVKPVAGVSEPLQALGVVLLSDDKPVVLCAIDWCEIRAADHVRWRGKIAQAAGTTAERVTVHSLHQHNAPLADSAAHQILAGTESPPAVIDLAWAEGVLNAVAAEVRSAAAKAQPLTHLTIGEGKVEQVASNRRIIGDNGKIAAMRLSATKDPKLRELPEGMVDPMLKTISLWNGDTKITALHYYATHPMSYYGDGMVTHDFVGIAREQRTREDGVPHIYFTGCGGNLAAGKYNDGSKEARTLLSGRIHAAMVESEKQTRRVPVQSIEWRVKNVLLTPNPEFTEERLMKVIANKAIAASQRISVAFRLSFARHCVAGVPIPFTSLGFGNEVKLLHLPGESFIEYQLFAQQQNPGAFVATAAYGDCGPGYIPLERSFAEGGYEPTQACAVPESEKQMRQVIEELLRPQP